MKYYNLKTMFGEYRVTIEKGKYQVNNTLALSLRTDIGEPYATMTVNLCGYNLKENEAFVDTNNCSWAEKFIKDNDLGKETGIVGQSGFCSYPLYQFNLDKI